MSVSRMYVCQSGLYSASVCRHFCLSSCLTVLPSFSSFIISFRHHVRLSCPSSLSLHNDYVHLSSCPSVVTQRHHVHLSCPSVIMSVCHHSTSSCPSVMSVGHHVRLSSLNVIMSICHVRRSSCPSVITQRHHVHLSSHPSVITPV